jgi:hypothetical protein
VEATTSIIEQDRESRIRERLTNSGREWAAARPRHRTLGTAEDLIGMDILPNPLNTSAGHGLEEAEIQENYGEVPGRLTDRASGHRRR